MLHRLIVALLLLCVAVPAAAQEDDGPTDAQVAERLYERGLEQFERKEFATAALTFLQALDLDPNAILAYNVAKAYENNGELENARKYYERTLELNPDDGLRTRVEDSLHRLDASEARLRAKLQAAAPKTGIVKVSSNKISTVLLDGEARGETPMEFELDPGTYQVEIRKANHEPFAQTIEVVAGGEVTVAANVVENSTALAWTGVGLVGGGLVLGGVGALAASGARQKFDEAQSLEAQRDPELFDKLRTEGENGKLAAQVLYGGAVLLGGTGVTMIVLWWLGLESEDVPLENSATIQIGPTSVSVGMRW